eukprot:jgi/Botrbrau1/143/Bobra.0022s0128.1
MPTHKRLAPCLAALRAPGHWGPCLWASLDLRASVQSSGQEAEGAAQHRCLSANLPFLIGCSCACRQEAGQALPDL